MWGVWGSVGKGVKVCWGDVVGSVERDLGYGEWGMTNSTPDNSARPTRHWDISTLRRFGVEKCDL